MHGMQRFFAVLALVIVALTCSADAAPYDPADVPFAPAAAVVLSSSALAQDTTLYQPWFDAVHWSGDLIAFAIDPASGQTTTPRWSAARLLTARDWRERLIVTRRDDTGQAIALRRFEDLSPAQQTALGDQATLDYLRGDASQEGTRFRVRRGVNNKGDWVRNILGPIIHADPQYVGNGAAARVYAAANDGMLHVFAAADGHEQYAYLPGMLYHRLATLADVDATPPSYTMDGGITVASVQFQNGAQHTVLVGALGAGGQGLYALDISTAADNDEAAALQSILWEFTDADDAALGYVHAAAQIVRLNDGHWAALVGNGYGSTAEDGHRGSGTAALLIIDIESGRLLRRIDTYAGDGADANGLGPARAIDSDADGRADYVYAGDLQGHLWRFDLRDANSSNWHVSFNSAPLYSARDTEGQVQAITSAPAIIAEPQQGARILFGTGRLLSWADLDPVNGRQNNALYSVLDRLDSSLPDTDKPVHRTLSETTYAADVRVFTVGDETQAGGADVWRMDLPAGARVVTDPVLDNGRLVITVSQPLIDGGETWLLAVDALSGGAPRQISFDMNGDGRLDAQDNAHSNDAGSTLAGEPIVGRYFGTGLGSAPTFGNLDATRRVAYINRFAADRLDASASGADGVTVLGDTDSTLSDTTKTLSPDPSTTLIDSTVNLVDTAPPCGVNGCVAEARHNPGRVAWKELTAE